MSYILDALRRADAEREQAVVPGIHSVATSRMAGDGPKRPAASNPLVWVIVGLSMVLMVVLIWIGAAQGEPAPMPVRVEAAATVAVPPVASVTAPAAVPELQPSPPVMAEPKPVPEPAARKPANPPVRAAARPAPAPKTAASAEIRVPPMSELPDQIRAELPALTVGGAMYSQQKANRMLIVNGQLLHEGDHPAPGVTLEQIRLKSAVLEYKGHRYSISY